MSDLVLPAELMDQPDFADELDDALLVGGDLPEPAKAWAITSLSGAEWCMRKLAALSTRAAAVADQASVWRSRIDVFESDEMNRLRPALRYFTGQLERWSVAERDADPKRMTFALPSGEVSTRRATEPSVRLDVEATDEALVEWCGESLTGEEYELVVKTKPKILISELRKLVKIEEREADEDGAGEYVVVLAASGEVVPGLGVDVPVTVPTVKPFVG